MQETVNAQDGNTIYFMNNIPQSNYSNPAILPNCNFYLGIPAMSSIGINIENGSFSYNDVFSRRQLNPPYDSLYVDKDKLLSALSDNNKLSYDISEQLFALGFRVRRNYFTLSAATKMSVNYNYTKEFMTFLLKGNEPFIGKTANLSDSKLGLNAYSEIALGFSREINKKLTLGFRFKYLIGIVNVFTEKSNLLLYTDANNYALKASSDFLIHSSSPFDSLQQMDKQIENLRPSDFTKNTGIAFDFGGEYRLNNQWSFGMSVIDLGSINWKSNLKEYRSNKPDKLIEFNGLDINQAFPDGKLDTTVINALLDSLKDAIGIDEYNGASYRAPLKTKLYTSIAFSLTPNDRFGLLMRNDFANKSMNTLVSVSYNRNIGKWFAFTISNTFVAGDFLNPGGGFTVNLGALQFYFIGDHFSSFYAADMKNMGLHFGFNLLIDRTKQGYRYKKEKPVLLAEEDLWIRKKRIVVLIDADNDGIADEIDRCPETPVNVKVDSLGCPVDTDKDSIPDYLDKCPAEKGLAKFQGCPDTDDDGIQDAEDKCPMVKGILAFQGCPDTDGDSIQDAEDRCPMVKGILAFQGCPDTDGDSIQDAEDRCPQERGSLVFQGCPDSDNDSIPDIDDKCPETPGIRANYGCPEVKPAIKELFKKALQGIQFAIGNEVILKPSYKILDQVAQVMKENPNYKLSIIGHTDNVGKAEKNKILSEKRALAVKNYLLKKGIDAARIKAVGYGDTMPVGDNKTKAGQKQNRRVEFIVEF